MPVLDLIPDQRDAIASRKATCPFSGPAIRSGALPVHGTPGRPLASVSDVARLGDTGGGSLGSQVLTVFAVGNHGRVPDAAGRFDAPAPDGFFSLDFPGSQGAHPGDSRILLAHPARLESGRIDLDAFARLAARADDRGMLTIAAVGAFIAENVARDRASRRLAWRRVMPRLIDVVQEGTAALLSTLGIRPRKRDHARFLQELTSIAAEDNLVGSAGEFGLLFAFLARRPGAGSDDEIRLADVETMMVEGRLPEGWEAWPKHTIDWVEATGELVLAALRTRPEE